jgi:hypothetical protein
MFGGEHLKDDEGEEKVVEREDGRIHVSSSRQVSASLAFDSGRYLRRPISFQYFRLLQDIVQQIRPNLPSADLYHLLQGT